MFLKTFTLKRKPISSNASRKITKYHHNWVIQKKINHLSSRLKWSAGKGATGSLVIRTKSALLRRYRTIKINYSLRYNKLGFVSSFQFIPFKNKILSLVYFSNGSLTYYITAEFHKIFNYWYLNKHARLKKFFHSSPYAAIFKIKKLSYISLIELLPGKGVQYSRASGTSARILQLTSESQSALIKLPSGVKKLFSYYSLACLGKIRLSNKKRFSNTKSGYWRAFGVKSIVRGVAMNPVDHPHGGRTKAIKYPRTPWGKTTKYK